MISIVRHQPTSRPFSRRLASVTLTLMLLPGVMLAVDVKEGTFDSDGTSIRYITKGQGDPIVLIHGFSASAEANWVVPGIFDRLSEEFQVIALDNRGHGKSDKPHDPAQYGVHMVEDVIKLLDHLEIEQAHIAGYSMGGFITMKLLVAAPERFLSAIVGGAGWSRASDDRSIMIELAESLEQGRGVGPLLRALQPVDGDPPTPEQVEMTNNLILSMNDPLALAAAIRGMSELTIRQDLLEANEVPTLAVIGSRDPLKEGVDAMDGVMSELQIVVLDGADHMSALMDPEHSSALVEAVRSFVIELCQCA